MTLSAIQFSPFNFCVCLLSVQAGLRAVHDLGPEIRRAISGNLDEDEFPERDVEEPMHRVMTQFLVAVLFL